MATGGKDATAVTDSEWREQQRFFNFLQHYGLHRYHQRFLQMGVTRITHFKDVSDADLDAVGLSPPEKTRLRKKLDENFSTTGKIKRAFVGKSKKFEAAGTTDQSQAHHAPLDPTSQAASLIAREDIKLENKIGEGAHGTVFEGTWSNVHGSVVVAVKTLYGKDEVQDTFIKEADSMRALLHQHIIQLYGIVLSSPLMLVQELAPWGNLHTFLEAHGTTKNPALFHTYAVQIADAMKYLEEKRLVHRDLATRNILLASEDFLKLSDFGMARILDEQTGIYNLSNLQTRIPIAWTALEALTRAKFSSASDVWSFAVTLWEIYSLGAVPWKGLTPIEIRDSLVQGERLGCPERCPREMYHVMETCWEERPQDRPTFTSLHQRLQRSTPRQVRAINPYRVVADEDSTCLSFQKGDLIFLIDKPKQGWMFGMLEDGKVGYFLEEHVTDIIDPIGDIKEKLQTGKARVADLPISGPTQVSHELHWGKDGTKWSNAPEELMGSEQARAESRSPLLKSPPYRVVNSSPQHSPVSKHRPPDSALAESRYTPHSSSCSPTQSGSEVGSPTYPMSPIHQQADPFGNPSSPTSSKATPEHNQYVTMKRGATMVGQGGEEEDGSEKDDYLEMNPNPTGIIPRYENIQRAGNIHDIADEDFYSVPRSRDAVLSDSSSSDGDSRPGSVARNGRFQLPPRGQASNHRDDKINLAELRTKTLPAKSTRVPSQYSMVSQVSQELLADSPTGALSPTNVRYLPTALPTSSGVDPEMSAKCRRSLGDIRYAEREKSDSFQVPNQTPKNVVRPRPKPRQSPIQVQRSASVASPNMKTKCSRKSSFPTTPEADRNTLSEAVRHLTLDSAHQQNNHTPQAHNDPDSDREPLIPIEAPLIPARTYLPSNPSKGSNTHKPGISQTHSQNPLVAEFPDTAPEVCQKALETHGFDISKAREEIQVQILLGMSIPNMVSDDCRRALKHCQWKIDRAAGWLVERSEELGSRRI